MIVGYQLWLLHSLLLPVLVLATAMFWSKANDPYESEMSKKG